MIYQMGKGGGNRQYTERNRVVEETTNMGILAPVWQEGSNVKISLLAKGSNVKNRKTLDP